MAKPSTIRRSNPDKGYTHLPTVTLQDRTLSWQARGLLCYLLSKPKDWQINVRHLGKESDKNGRDATCKALDELICAKYIQKEQCREKGRFLGYEYVVYDMPVAISPQPEKPDTDNQETDSPQPEKPDTEKPDTGKPYPENPSLQSIDVESTELQSTEDTNFDSNESTDAHAEGKKTNENFQGQLLSAWEKVYIEKVGEQPKAKRTKNEFVAVAEFANHVRADLAKKAKPNADEDVLARWVSFCTKAWDLDNEVIQSNFTPGTLWGMYDRINAALAAKRAKPNGNLKGLLPMVNREDLRGKGGLVKPNFKTGN